jgi:hypothetical protein
MKIYTRIEFGIICKGNESSLFDCNPDTSDEIADACQSLGDATLNLKSNEQTTDAD